ncbi:Nicotinate phosphoribosyltransferase [Eumeta japonica]|uniref:nicotinate phosphoribosyltransferase n=1 Tax=Eumeta variegata TaxID=151549 RepID=A0A4C1ZP98_EUMVA|nr:Nicotinate phosphoribosyltransferase [Eumeta japonica]
MATNAARYRMVAGKNVSLLEFGLRRAQGPDGGLSASKYSYIGRAPPARIDPFGAWHTPRHVQTFVCELAHTPPTYRLAKNARIANITFLKTNLVNHAIHRANSTFERAMPGRLND